MRMRAIALLGVLLLLAPAASGAASLTSPTSVVKSFYAWYFATPSPWDHLSGARPFFTTSLYELLSRVMPYERRTHGEVLDADPFIDAQIASSGVAVGSESVGGVKAAVVVVVHYPKTSAGDHVQVMLVKTADGWRIDDFVGAVGGSVRTNLERAMK